MLFKVSPSTTSNVMAVTGNSVSDQLLHESDGYNADYCTSADNIVVDMSTSGAATRPEVENGRAAGVQRADGRQQQQVYSDNDAMSTPPVYKVLVLGSQGVGKTTLVEQLMTSEYLANQENCTSGQSQNESIYNLLFVVLELCGVVTVCASY